MSDPNQPLDYQSPFDRPLKPRVASKPPFWRRRGFRIGYWIVCLTLIGVLLLWIHFMLSQFEGSAK